MKWLARTGAERLIDIAVVQAGIYDLELAGAAGTDTSEETTALQVLRALGAFFDVLDYLHRKAIEQEAEMKLPPSPGC